MRNIAQGSAPIALLAFWLSGVVGQFAWCAEAPPAYRDDCEAEETSWHVDEDGTDTVYRIHAHERSRQTVHRGMRSERLLFAAGNGTKLWLSHPIDQARFIEELKISVWVKSNRPGLQLMARVVLPDPENSSEGEPVVALLRGDHYQTAGRWQRLAIRDPGLLLKRQLQLLRYKLDRDVHRAGAYVSDVLLNAYSGPGTTEVFLDDLELVPLVQTPSTTDQAADTEIGSAASTPDIRIRQGQLYVNGRPVLLRAVNYRGESLELLKALGFQAVYFEEGTDPDLLGRARDLGLWAMADAPQEMEGVSLSAPPWDSVLIWSMGKQLSSDRVEEITEQADNLRNRDAQRRPITGVVSSGLRSYSRQFDLVGLQREPLLGRLGPKETQKWFQQQSLLARPGTGFWTWIDTEPDARVERMAAHAAGQQSGEAAGLMEPEQIRLLTYAALAGGCRGVGYWSRRSLEGTDPATRERQLTLALLNLEIELLGDWMSGASRLASVASNRREIDGTLYQTARSRLLLASWKGPDSQFVPGQAADNDVTFVVPLLPESTAAWRVSLTGVESLDRERRAGGVQITLPEFGMTEIVLFSNDPAELRALNERLQRTRRQAARWAMELAELKLHRVVQVDRQLRALGRAQPDGGQLVQTAELTLASSRRSLSQGAFVASYQMARRALRPLRILQRAHWESATDFVASPLVSPYSVCFGSLPLHWNFADSMRNAAFDGNLLSQGAFEDPDRVAEDGWKVTRQESPDFDAVAELSEAGPRDGRFCLRMMVQPTDPERGTEIVDGIPLQVTSAPIPVEPGQVLRISGWVQVISPITGSVDGVMLTDSMSGPGLALRWDQQQDWQPFEVYRTASESGTLTVKIALTGYGEVQFDDLSVERVLFNPKVTTRPRGDVR